MRRSVRFGSFQVLEFEQDIFAFSTKKPGLHKICFRSNAREARRVVLEVKTDIETKDYSEVIRKEHLKPLELEFLKAEDTMRQVARSARAVTEMAVVCI